MIPTYTDDCLQKHFDLSRLQIMSCQYSEEMTDPCVDHKVDPDLHELKGPDGSEEVLL